MVKELFSLVLVGLGIIHSANGGMVAGLADIRTTAPNKFTATASPELKERREKGLQASASAHAAFREKLSTIRDAKKKALTERLNTTLNDVNTKRTETLLSYLSRISDILSKVQARAAIAKANGKDTSAVDGAIAKAQADIATAKAAILAQAGKQYTTTITSEDSLKSDMGKTMSQLQNDLGSVRTLVVAAHKSVSDAIAALAAVLGEPPPKTASGSGAPK